MAFTLRIRKSSAPTLANDAAEPRDTRLSGCRSHPRRLARQPTIPAINVAPKGTPITGLAARRSSKEGTARFGKTFDRGQVFDHVAKAVLKAMRVVAAEEARAGVAFPDDANHRREVEQVAPALARARIAVFWVSEQGGVRSDAPWPL